MSNEGEPRSSKINAVKSPVNPHRAYRKLERWLFNGVSEEVRSETASGVSLPANLFDGGEHMMTIVYKSEVDEQGNITNIKTSYLNPEGEQIASDSTSLKTE